MSATLKLVLIVLGIICFIIRGFALFPTGKYDLGWIGAALIAVALLL